MLLTHEQLAKRCKRSQHCPYVNITYFGGAGVEMAAVDMVSKLVTAAGSSWHVDVFTCVDVLAPLQIKLDMHENCAFT